MFDDENVDRLRSLKFSATRELLQYVMISLIQIINSVLTFIAADRCILLGIPS